MAFFLILLAAAIVKPVLDDCYCQAGIRCLAGYSRDC